MKKWFWCSWRHRSDRCSFEVWKPANERSRWHCARCHPCGEEIDRLIEWLEKNTVVMDPTAIDGSDSQNRS